MTDWNPDDLATIHRADELRIATRRTDGSLTRSIPIWHAAVGDCLYIRSAHGPENGWFRRAVAAGEGHIGAGGVEKDVAFELAPADIRDELDRALHAKYDRYGPGPVGAITGADVLETTLRVTPTA